MANHLTYLLNALLDEDEDGVPDAQQRGMRQGIPRTPGMSLGAPSADGRMDEYLGIDQPELDTSADPGFDASPLDQFLERFSQGGVPGGMQRPQGFGQGLLSGIAQGAVGRGGRVTERRKKFEESQRLRSAERDKANLAATQKYRDRVVDEGLKRAGEDRTETRRQREERSKYERDNPKPTPEQLQAMPWLSRQLDADGRVPRDYFTKEDPGLGAAKETRRRFESDRDFGLRSRKDAFDRSQASGPNGGKPPTIDAKRSAAFAERGRKAISNPDFVGLEDRIVKGGNVALLGLGGPRMLQTDDQKKYRQGVETFALAFLREESMASIRDEEFQQVFRTFFAQPGENAETIEGKRQAREAALLGQEQKGESAGSRPLPPIPATWKKVN